MIHKIELSDEDVRKAILRYVQKDGTVACPDNIRHVHLKSRPQHNDPREPQVVTGYEFTATVVITKG